jgi:SAM-dependent methyltransferase
VETDLLDVRPGDPSNQIKSAAHIPIEALPEAQSELPDKNQTIRIANTGPEALQAQEILNHQAQLETNFTYTTGQPPHRLWRPNDFLAEILPNLKPATAMDLACGAGREAAYLSQKGWQVTAVDHLPDALTRAKSLAQRYGQTRIQWLQNDLRNWRPGQPYDLVTMFFYLDRPLIQQIAPLTKNLIFESFSPQHRATHNKPKEPLTISQEELKLLVQPLQIRHLSEEQRTSGRHTTRLWAQRQTK